MRRQTVESWLEAVTERALARDFAAARPTVPQAPLLVLSAAEFAEAVRRALRDLPRPDLLAESPPTRSKLASGAPRPELALQQALRDAAGRLAIDPRDAALHHVLDRTYLRPAASQERAAEVLSLPLSTYKRHLRRAVERLIVDLWGPELFRHSVVISINDEKNARPDPPRRPERDGPTRAGTPKSPGCIP